MESACKDGVLTVLVPRLPNGAVQHSATINIQ